MKNIVVALATGLVIVSVGMPRPAAAQDSTAGMTAKTRKTAAISRRMTGEVLAVNRGEEALTMRSMTNGKETDVIFSVQDAAAPVLDVLEPGDLVLVTYVRANDQLRAQRIVRVEGSPQQQQEGSHDGEENRSGPRGWSDRWGRLDAGRPVP